MVTVFGFIQVIIWHNGLFQIGGKKFLEYLERDVERNEEILNRDYLYKIIEYSVNRREFPDSMLITYQPPYKSEKLTKVSEETLQKNLFRSKCIFFCFIWQCCQINFTKRCPLFSDQRIITLSI